MEEFVSVDELLEGWPGKELDGRGREQAHELIRRASAMIWGLMRRRGVEIDPGDEAQRYNLRTVCCNMVRRAMAPSGAEGVSQVSQTIGSTTASVQWANPDGAFYLSRMDKEVLGLTGGGRVGWAPLARGDGR